MKFSRTFLQLAIEKSIPSILQLSIHLILARDLGPSSYEQIGLLALIVQFTYPLIDLGLSHSLLAKRLDFNGNQSVYNSVSTIITISALLFIFILGLVSMVKGVNIYLYVGYSLTLLSHAFTILPKINLLNTGKAKSLALAQVYSTALSFLVFIISFSFYSPIKVFAIYLATYSLTQAAIIFKANPYYLKWKLRRSVISSHMRFAFNISFISYLSAFFEHFITFLSNLLILTSDIIGAFHLSRRAISLGANAIIDPMERTIFVGGGTKFLEKSFMLRITGISLLLFTMLFFFSKYSRNNPDFHTRKQMVESF
ncbi:MAG: oligosaccharide flippase family protein [Schleiferiaceae bacterium]